MAEKWKFEDNSIELAEALDKAGEKWLQDATRILHRQVVQNTAVDTTDTKTSWKKVVAGNKGTVGSTSENAIWEEFGTGHYAVNGDGNPSPWYVPVQGYTGKKKPTYKGKVVVVYGKNGMVYYKTDGKKPRRALENAKKSTEKKIRKRLETLLKEAMK
ncbi:MAG: HK97 gp10 family phage protein [Bullifex sp.]